MYDIHMVQIGKKGSIFGPKVPILILFGCGSRAPSVTQFVYTKLRSNHFISVEMSPQKNTNVGPISARDVCCQQ